MITQVYNPTKILPHYVVKKFGKYTLEKIGNKLVLCDGFFTNWLICYGNGKWASDKDIYRKDIREYLYKNCNKLGE